MNKTQEYVLTFLFTPDFKFVWLIKKEKPEWQKGLLNGIGGKIEAGEDPLYAAIRELREETGVANTEYLLRSVGVLDGTNNDESPFKVYVYAAITKATLRTVESEVVLKYRLEYVSKNPTVENVPALVELCLYKLRGNSHFSTFEMKY